MLIVQVQIHVKPGYLEAFKTATQANVAGSVKEPGILRFEFYQEKEDETRFLLVEVYRTPEAILSHKETTHYLTWRDTVNEMMAEPRKGIWYTHLAPIDVDRR